VKVEDEKFMAKRMLVMLTLTLLFVGALGFVKFKQIQTAIAQGAAYQPPPEAVTTVIAAQEQWPSTINAIGHDGGSPRRYGERGSAGIVEQILFESGDAVREGQTLAILDTRQEQAQMAAAEAQRVLARLNFNRMQELLDQQVISKAEYESATAQSRETEARVGEIRPPSNGRRSALRSREFSAFGR
jgi:membrane fusion protein (multidrug efflux system)